MTRKQAIEALERQGWNMAPSGIYSGYVIWRRGDWFKFGVRSFSGRGNRKTRVSYITSSSTGWEDLVNRVATLNKPKESTQ